MAKKSLIAIQELLTANPSKYSNENWIDSQPPEWLTTIQFNPPPSCRGQLCYLKLVNAAIYPQQIDMPSHYNEMPFTLSINFNQIDSFQSINNASGNNGPNTSKIVAMFCNRWSAGTEFPMITFQCPQGPQPLDLILQANTPEIFVTGTANTVTTSGTVDGGLKLYDSTLAGEGQNAFVINDGIIRYNYAGFVPSPGDTFTISSLTGNSPPASTLWPTNAVITGVLKQSSLTLIFYKTSNDLSWSSSTFASTATFSFTTNIVAPSTPIQLTMLANLEPIE